MAKNTITSEQLKDLWNNQGVKEKFESNTEETSAGKRFALAFIEIYHENLDNPVLAEILGCKTGEQRNWFEYREKAGIIKYIGRRLDIKTSSFAVVLEELGIAQDVKKIIKESEYIGTHKQRKYGAIR